jgi:hypothetical protein
MRVGIAREVAVRWPTDHHTMAPFGLRAQNNQGSPGVMVKPKRTNTMKMPKSERALTTAMKQHDRSAKQHDGAMTKHMGTMAKERSAMQRSMTKTPKGKR